ncbi:MAG: flagellar assembly protein FliW [Shouchella clausii]
MQLETSYLGTVEYKQEDIIVFQGGLPGFPEETEFILLPFNEQPPFFILQSVRTKEIGFVCINPFLFWPDYEVELSDSVVRQLRAESEQDVAIFVLLTIQQPFSETTANLRAPIAIHAKKRFAKQLMLDGERYSLKAPIHMAAKGGR